MHDDAAQAGAGAIVGLFILLILAVMYFLPTVIAAARKHTQTLAIFVLNLLLGWSVIGWIGALVWSLTNSQPTQTIIYQQAPPPGAPPQPPPNQYR